MSNVYDREAITRATKFARGLESLERQQDVELIPDRDEIRFVDRATGAIFALGEQSDEGYERGLGIAED